MEKLKEEIKNYLDKMGNSNINLGSPFAREMMVNELMEIIQLNLDAENE
jgi:isopropylmalate/homocitrate/citramalate synthase